MPGASLDTESNVAGNRLPALDALEWPWCPVELPEKAMADVQRAGEHVAYAIRTMHARYGRKVQVVGFSAGRNGAALVARHARQGRGLVGLAPSNHGTVSGDAVRFARGGCAPAVWQQRSRSAFLRALDSPQETFSPVAYTSIYTRGDDDRVVVAPDRRRGRGRTSRFRTSARRRPRGVRAELRRSRGRLVARIDLRGVRSSVVVVRVSERGGASARRAATASAFANVAE